MKKGISLEDNLQFFFIDVSFYIMSDNYSLEIRVKVTKRYRIFLYWID